MDCQSVRFVENLRNVIRADGAAADTQAELAVRKGRGTQGGAGQWIDNHVETFGWRSDWGCRCQ